MLRCVVLCCVVLCCVILCCVVLFYLVVGLGLGLGPANSTKPSSYKKASDQPLPQWFRAEAKERDRFLEFDTWERIDQAEVTDAIRRRTLRCHHLYDIKRDDTAKNRVVVNGSKQHSDTYTDTTSPVASQLQLRLFLAVSAFRQCNMVQLDLTNAYLHASIFDVVYIYIPEGFPGQEEIARLRKAAYGTKQGARRFYDYTATVLKHIGLTQCPTEPCLFRYLTQEGEFFLIQYVDDSLIAGQPKAIEKLESEMKKYFKCKFVNPKDFLGLDLSLPNPGKITLSMSTFTSKMISALQMHDTYPGDIITPGRTDKKVIRGEKPERNESYRSKVGSLNWLTMGIRYDISYTTKELSRVLAEPTETANDILNRTLLYINRTQHAYLAYDHTTMLAYKTPPTRKKSTDIDDTYNVDYNTTDGITHEDEKESSRRPHLTHAIRRPQLHHRQSPPLSRYTTSTCLSHHLDQPTPPLNPRNPTPPTTPPPIAAHATPLQPDDHHHCTEPNPPDSYTEDTPPHTTTPSPPQSLH